MVKRVPSLRNLLEKDRFAAIVLAVVAVVAIAKTAVLQWQLPNSVIYKIDKQEAELKSEMSTLPKEQKQSAKKAALLLALATLYQQAAQYDKAKQTAGEALACLPAEDFEGASQVHTLCADIDRDAGLFTQAQAEYEKSLALHKSKGDYHKVASDLSDLAALAVYAAEHISDRALQDNDLTSAERLLDQAEHTLQQNKLKDAELEQLISNYREMIYIDTDRFRDLSNMLKKDRTLWRGG